MFFESCAFLYKIQYSFFCSFFFIIYPGCCCFVLKFRDDAWRYKVLSVYFYQMHKEGWTGSFQKTSRYIGTADVMSTRQVIIASFRNQYRGSYSLRTVPKKVGNGLQFFSQNAAAAPITNKGAICICFIWSPKSQECKVSPRYWTDLRCKEMGKLCQILSKHVNILAKTQW